MAARGKPPAWFAFIAARWKAAAALVGSLATALLVIAPGSRALQVIIGVVGALLTTGVVHQVSNAGTAPVQKVVDAVTGLIPSPVVAEQVAKAVTNTTDGVLKTAVGTVGGIVVDTGDGGVGSPGAAQ